MRTQILRLGMILLLAIVFNSCGTTNDPIPCPQGNDIVSQLTDTDGNMYTIASDGNIYKKTNDGCVFFQKYFEPNYEANNYEHHNDSVYIKTSQGLFPIQNNFTENVEKATQFKNLFILSPADTNKHWNTITLQSPSAPTVKDYVALRTCIFNGSCTFKDNRIDISPDPQEPSNHVLKFTAVEPSASMVTSKSSMESTIAYFTQGSDLWYQARYYFTQNLPYSIADFESQWYDQSPGPRIVFTNGALAVENKFGNKIKFNQPKPVRVPINEWVTIKLHIKFHESQGTIELWQNGIQILTVHNQPTLPLRNAVQTNIEVGISATPNNCVLYMDDIQLSDKAF